MVLGKITYFCQTCSAYFSAPARWIRDYWSAWWVFSSVPRSLQSRTKMTLRSSIWRAPRMTFRLRNSRNPPWRFCSWEQILNGGIFQHAMFDPCLITREYGIHTIDGWYFNCGNSCWFRNSLHIWPCGHSIHPSFFFLPLSPFQTGREVWIRRPWIFSWRISTTVTTLAVRSWCNGFNEPLCRATMIKLWPSRRLFSRAPFMTDQLNQLGKQQRCCSGIPGIPGIGLKMGETNTYTMAIWLRKMLMNHWI